MSGWEIHRRAGRRERWRRIGQLHRGRGMRDHRAGACLMADGSGIRRRDRSCPRTDDRVAPRLSRGFLVDDRAAALGPKQDKTSHDDKSGANDSGHARNFSEGNIADQSGTDQLQIDERRER